MTKTKKTPASRIATTKSSVHKKSFLGHMLHKITDTQVVKSMRRRMSDFLQRRPHRSFRRTYRRDYVRSLNLPGYLAFTKHVHQVLWSNKKLIMKLLAAYLVISIAVIGLASQDLYAQLRDTLTDSGSEMFTGAWGEVGKAGLLLLAGVTGSFNGASAELQTQQQVFAVMIGLLTWLTTVWLLRLLLAGRSPKLRDGLYNAGAPIVPTFLVASVIVLQLLPLALALFGYNAAVASGLLEGGVEAMLFWTTAGLLAILSLYWLTSTLIALVVVTLPGMYPMQALRTAGDLVVGRRIRILLRIMWLVALVGLAWVVIVIPIILFDGWVKSVVPAIDWLPFIPLALLVMSSLTIVWTASYIYLLYRKVVDDDAAPA